MPSCGHTWELFQSMNDDPVKSCPKCKKRKAKRLLGVGAGLIFKGTGFYETDYKSKSGSEKKESSGRFRILRFIQIFRFWWILRKKLELQL